MNRFVLPLFALFFVALTSCASNEVVKSHSVRYTEQEIRYDGFQGIAPADSSKSNR